jgi:hypothetical protein
MDQQNRILSRSRLVGFNPKPKHPVRTGTNRGTRRQRTGSKHSNPMDTGGLPAGKKLFSGNNHVKTLHQNRIDVLWNMSLGDEHHTR